MYRVVDPLDCQNFKWNANQTSLAAKSVIVLDTNKTMFKKKN